MSSSKLAVGIVGLPNVGKSTLFNALLKKQQAYVANFPFATIEPNVGVVPVPDDRLAKLAEVVKKSEGMDYLPPEVPATVEFVDIAGLISGAHKGEGLGNKFLSHIREVDAICHVVRAFSDSEIVKSGSSNPKDDFEIVKLELDLADEEMIEKVNQKKKGNVEADLLPLFSKKPILVCLNVNEEDLVKATEVEDRFATDLGLHKSQVIAICAKTEAQLADLTPEDSQEYLKGLGVERSGLERLIGKAFETLGLITFLTAGEKEVRAWTLRRGETALRASGVIHTDFMKKFIKADVVDFDDFVNCQGGPASPKTASRGGWKICREEGKVRSEGRDYLMRDGDVVEFKIGT